MLPLVLPPHIRHSIQHLRLSDLDPECTWLAETFAEHAGTADDVLSEAEAVNAILRMSPAVDTQYINQKLKVCRPSLTNTCTHLTNIVTTHTKPFSSLISV